MAKKAEAVEVADSATQLEAIRKAEAAVARAERKVAACVSDTKDAKAALATAIARLRSLATGQGEFFAADLDAGADDDSE